MIVYNAGKCKKCGEVIESVSRHDFKSCSCGAIAVDGGLSYLRRSGDWDDFEELSVDYPAADFKIVREFAYRWEATKKVYVKLKNISDNWLQNIVGFYAAEFERTGVIIEMAMVYLAEEQYRRENEISVPENIYDESKVEGNNS